MNSVYNIYTVELCCVKVDGTYYFMYILN